MKVSRDQFNDFFNAKKTGTYKCPVCSNEQFNFLGGGPDDDLSVAGLEIADPKLVKSSHFFCAVSCSNCGHTTFFLRSMIAEWLKEWEKKNV